MSKTSLFKIIKKAIREKKHETNNCEPTTENVNPSRREFHKKTLLTTGYLSIPSWFAAAAQKVSAKSIDPIAILGAGFAGLTVAYRLKKAGIPFVIFEASERYGGRVFTQNKFNSENMFCELGAELVDSTHNDLISLVKELGLKIEDFREADKGFEGGVFEYQNKIYHYSDLKREVEPLCKQVVKDEQKIFPNGNKGSIKYYSTFNSKKFDEMNLDEYLSSIRDLAPWVREMIKIAYVGEYGLEAHQQSALNLIQMISKESGEHFEIFGESDESKRIVGGNSRLADVLAKRCGIEKNKDGNHIKWKHQLTGIQQTSSGLIKLLFKTSSGLREKTFRQVVCTIPFPVLRAIDGIDNLGLSPKKIKSIREFRYGTNSKLMMGFNSKIWRSGVGPSKPSNGSLYSVGFQSLWETSRLQKGERGILTNFTGGKMGENATKTEVKRILEFADLFYKGLAKDFDGKVAFLNWSKNPWSLGSYGCPGPGQYGSFYGIEGEPELSGQILFAGEHASSDWQGFMNGAIQSAEIAADKIIKSNS